MTRGTKLRAMQKRLRLKAAEICAEAGVSMGTLQRIYLDHPKVTDESVSKVIEALETLRQRVAADASSKVAG